MLFRVFTIIYVFFFFQAEDGIRDDLVIGVQTCALPIFETGSPMVTTFKSLIEHYREREMRMDNHDKKAYSTKKRNESYLRKWIVPRWGEHRPSDKIGRASCRERVENWVVAGAIKKKTQR